MPLIKRKPVPWGGIVAGFVLLLTPIVVAFVLWPR
jgi:hypothetical protein